jgi:hypothetical protein
MKNNMHYIARKIEGSFTAEAPTLDLLIPLAVVLLQENVDEDTFEVFDSEDIPLVARLLTEASLKRGSQMQDIHIDMWPLKPSKNSFTYLRVHVSCIDARRYPWFVSVEYSKLDLKETNETLAGRYRYFTEKK